MNSPTTTDKKAALPAAFSVFWYYIPTANHHTEETIWLDTDHLPSSSTRSESQSATMSARGIGKPNILMLGGGNIPWTVPTTRGVLDRIYEGPLHELRSLARKSRKLLAANDNDKHPAHAVYVVSDIKGEVSKIGLAHCPSSRLSRIQTGNPEELFLHRVFWIDSVRAAAEIERRSHELASPCGRLMGEWFCCPVHQAHGIIVKALDEMNIDYVAITPTVKTKEAA